MSDALSDRIETLARALDAGHTDVGAPPHRSEDEIWALLGEELAADAVDDLFAHLGACGMCAARAVEIWEMVADTERAWARRAAWVRRFNRLRDAADRWADRLGFTPTLEAVAAAATRSPTRPAALAAGAEVIIDAAPGDGFQVTVAIPAPGYLVAVYAPPAGPPRLAFPYQPSDAWAVAPPRAVLGWSADPPPGVHTLTYLLVTGDPPFDPETIETDATGSWWADGADEDALARLADLAESPDRRVLPLGRLQLRVAK